MAVALIVSLQPLSAFAVGNSITATDNGGGSWTITATISTPYGGSTPEYAGVTFTSDNGGTFTAPSASAYTSGGAVTESGLEAYGGSTAFIYTSLNTDANYIVATMTLSGVTTPFNITATGTLWGGGSTTGFGSWGPFGTAAVTKYTLTNMDGTGSGSYAAGDTVTISPYPASTGFEFAAWRCVTQSIPFNYTSGGAATFPMPASNITIYADWEPIQYEVTVTNGSADRRYVTYEDVITITADPAPTGQHFAGWQVVSGDITLADPTAATTTFSMPASDVTIEATYAPDSTQPPSNPTTSTPSPSKLPAVGSGAGTSGKGTTLPPTGDSSRSSVLAISGSLLVALGLGFAATTRKRRVQ